jgi:hypothetical protein
MKMKKLDTETGYKLKQTFYFFVPVPRAKNASGQVYLPWTNFTVIFRQQSPVVEYIFYSTCCTSAKNSHVVDVPYNCLCVGALLARRYRVNFLLCYLPGVRKTRRNKYLFANYTLFHFFPDNEK